MDCQSIIPAVADTTSRSTCLSRKFQEWSYDLKGEAYTTTCLFLTSGKVGICHGIFVLKGCYPKKLYLHSSDSWQCPYWTTWRSGHDFLHTLYWFYLTTTLQTYHLRGLYLYGEFSWLTWIPQIPHFLCAASMEALLLWFFYLVHPLWYLNPWNLGSLACNHIVVLH